jgi:hypothetical protein
LATAVDRRHLRASGPSPQAMKLSADKGRVRADSCHTRSIASVEMKAWKCPSCGERAGVPVQYGLPSREMAEAAERGEVVLGGCVLTDDDPPRCCTECRAALWPGGVFAVPGADGDMRITLAGGRTGRRLEASVSRDWEVTIGWRGDEPREADMTVASGEADFFLALLATEVLDDGAALMRWLQRHGLGFVGSLEGPADRCAIARDGMVSFSGCDGDVLVHSSVERLLLLLAKTMYRRQGFRSIAELDGWLSAFGFDVARSG